MTLLPPRHCPAAGWRPADGACEVARHRTGRWSRTATWCQLRRGADSAAGDGSLATRPPDVARAARAGDAPARVTAAL